MPSDKRKRILEVWTSVIIKDHTREDRKTLYIWTLLSYQTNSLTMCTQANCCHGTAHTRQCLLRTQLNNADSLLVPWCHRLHILHFKSAVVITTASKQPTLSSVYGCYIRIYGNIECGWLCFHGDMAYSWWVYSISIHALRQFLTEVQMLSVTTPFSMILN